MVNLNAKRYAQAARYDKIRLVYAGHDEQTINKVWANMLELAAEHLRWSPQYATEHIKLEPYWSKGKKHGYYLQLTWRACELVHYLRFDRAHTLTEVEVKAYVEEVNDIAYYAFIDAVDYGATEGRLNTYKVTNGAHSSKKKSGAQRSTKVGSNKSSHQGGIYKRQGERPGIEVAVRRAPLRRIAQETETALADVEGDGSDAHRWVALMRRVAYRGYVVFEAELSKRGVEVKDYFSHFTREADPRRLPTDDSAITDNGSTAQQLGLEL